MIPSHAKAFGLMLCLISCKSQDTALRATGGLPPEPIQAELASDVAAAPAPPKPELCETLPVCPEEEHVVPYQCVAYRYQGQFLWEGQRLHAWGSSLCQAQHSLAQVACRQDRDLAQLGDVSCTPDPTMGACPAPSTPCPETSKPSKCFATSYKGQDLSWEQRPTGWGRNECVARQKVAERACEQGLEPTGLSRIQCETDLHPGQCPPPPPSCDPDQKVPTECFVSQLGDIVLKKPWKTVGTSRCEAEHRLRELACRFANPSNQLTPQRLTSIECRSLVSQGIPR